MIEITTGVVFLMSSLYGSGQSVTQVASVAQAIGQGAAQTTEIAKIDSNRTFTDSHELEAYLREEYADTPILVEVARCESTFRHFGSDGETVIRGKVNKDDIGVMQINEHYHGDTAEKMGLDLHSVEGNVAYAKYLYGKYGTKPWNASSACWSKPASEIARN